MYGNVAVLGRAVDDDVEVFAAPGRHQVVNDPAIVVEQQRIFWLHVLRGAEIAGHERFEHGIDIAAMNEQLTHVADIEQARILASPHMLGDDSFILNRHFITGERHHPAAALSMPRVERKLVEGGVWCQRLPEGSPAGDARAPGRHRSGRYGLQCSCHALQTKGATGEARLKASPAAPVCP